VFEIKNHSSIIECWSFLGIAYSLWSAFYRWIIWYSILDSLQIAYSGSTPYGLALIVHNFEVDTTAIFEIVMYVFTLLQLKGIEWIKRQS